MENKDNNYAKITVLIWKIESQELDKGNILCDASLLNKIDKKQFL